MAFADETKNFKLAIRQICDGRPLLDLCAACEAVEHAVGHAVADINLSAQDAADSHQHAVRRLLLHDVTVGAGAQGALGVERLVEHGQNQHRQIRVACANIFEKVQTVRPVERNVHYD